MIVRRWLSWPAWQCAESIGGMLRWQRRPSIGGCWPQSPTNHHLLKSGWRPAQLASSLETPSRGAFRAPRWGLLRATGAPGGSDTKHQSGLQGARGFLQELEISFGRKKSSVVKPSDGSRAKNFAHWKLTSGSELTKGCEVYQPTNQPIAIPNTSQLCASQKIKENIYILTNSVFSFLVNMLMVRKRWQKLP